MSKIKIRYIQCSVCAESFNILALHNTVNEFLFALIQP